MTPVRRIAPGELAERGLQALVDAGEPVVVQGAAADWPLVAAGREGARAAADHLRGFYGGRPVTGYVGDASIGGRFFYDEAVAGLNFTAERAPLESFLQRIFETLGEVDAPSYYLGSTDAEGFFPGLRAGSPLPGEAALPSSALVSLWIGNRTVAATHYDMSNNAAVCAVGRRRFTLFPPEAVADLYPGPLEPTPGGQVVSMVDPRAPDLGRYPRFEAALETAQVAELGPGDLIVYPALWWHQVESLEPFNVLVNWWWNTAPRHLDTPMTTLLHGLLSLRDRPDAEKRAWREMFDFYVFGPAERAAEHLPPAARGPLAPLEEAGARRLRAHVVNRLNR